ncbi:DUF2750 domain-containing protein [Psychrobium sp. nBUS_13]|uniref:DUF2750 domain-containing protein n=1 Tax=Psychrobium sp. nBUS_13 TaxID=3395319 RepID=UPI003EBA7BE3
MNQQLDNFATAIKLHQEFYGLFDENSQEWVIVDATNNNDGDALPLWSTKELASVQLTGEWKGFVLQAISIEDWLEFWMDDLQDSAIVIGINWGINDNLSEVSLTDFTNIVMQAEDIG